MAFLTIINIKSAAIAEAPVIASSSEVSWFDIMVLYNTILIGASVLNVILGDYLLQHYGFFLLFHSNPFQSWFPLSFSKPRCSLRFRSA